MTPRAPKAGFDLRGFAGLGPAQAQQRLAAEGPNEIPGQGSRSLLAIVFEVVREPMFLMLVAAAALYFMLGELGDALTLGAFVVVVVTITIVQERRTEHALDALRDLSSPRALVIRGGEALRIAGREVVRGDLLILAEGDRVPADALVRRALNLAADESLLTGESVPVRKKPSETASAAERPGGDDLASVFSGTLITAGQGVAEVVATGARSEIGKIGRALLETESEPTRLQRETRTVVKRLAVIGIALSLIVVVIYALTRGNTAASWNQGALAGIALAMAMLPEEFPVVLTVYLAIGAWRLSRNRVLARRMPAVEALGATTVLCTDKTGTLTQNQMTVARLVAGGTDVATAQASELPEDVHTLTEVAILASKRDPFDPMERALAACGDRYLARTEHLHPEWALEREYPSQPGLFAVTHLWRGADSAQLEAASKGAPEAIAELCRLAPAPRAAMLAAADRLASEGLRVLAVARGRIARGSEPEQHAEVALELVGLLGFEDPLRATVPAAVAECHRAGIRVVMVTGDYPTTARAIARQAGIEVDGGLMTGEELERTSDEELAGRIDGVRIFARVVPDQKLRIVHALAARGEVVAMTGDGINDAPALKAAHIGVAMGGRGTDVAREAAGLVVLDDDFSSIVGAVRLGRRIFDNIRKATVFIIAVHVPIAALSLLPVFVTSWPLLLLPIHVAFLELVIDPACSLIFEAEPPEPGIMTRPPRRPDERLFTRSAVGIALLQGLSVTAACVGVLLFEKQGHSPESSRALAFTTLVVGLVVMVLANRSWNESILSGLRHLSRVSLAIVGATVATLTLALTVPVVQHRFQFAPVHPTDLLIAVSAGVLCLAWLEGLKLLRRRRATSQPSA